MRNILVTGAAGFIGFHLTYQLLKAGFVVYGIDNLNSYYAVTLKQDRLKELSAFDNFVFKRFDIAERTEVERLFRDYSFDGVVHLAAQAGVRYSLQNPHAYADSNLTGFINILEGCRYQKVGHLVYASSSSVYGANKKVPFATSDNVDNPVSLYAATKKANELMAHAYSHLYQIPTTGLRFFTVYGPWGRPDMAYYKFVDAIASGRPISIYNHGQMKRDFTYIDDVVKGIIKTLKHIPSDSTIPYKIYNIGNHSPVSLMDFIQTIELAMGKTAEKHMLPMQPGDVPMTYANVDDLIADVGFKPETPLEVGIIKFVDWYQSYHRNQISPKSSLPIGT